MNEDAAGSTRPAGRIGDRASWLSLAVAGAISAALILYLNRGSIFFFDEAVWFADLSRLHGAELVLRPHNSHLHGLTRLLYWLTAEAFGTHYVIQRIMGVIAVLAASGVFFAWAKRRVPNEVALVPAVLLLFYGSAWQHVVDPIGFTILMSAAFGLGALIALERDDLRGDVVACALAALAAFTFTVGLGFLVAVGIWIALRPGRLRRAWVFLVPLALYSGWYLWAQQFQQTRVGLGKIGNAPGFFLDSVPVDVGGLTGVNVPFSRLLNDAAINVAPASTLGWIVSAAFVAALVWRLSRGNVPLSLWSSLAVPGTYWLAASLADPLFFGNLTDSIRYVYPGSFGLLMIAVDAASGLRFRMPALAAVWAVGVFSLAMNLVFLKDGAAYVRDDYSLNKAVTLSMLELADGLEPGADGSGSARPVRPAVAPDALIPFLGFGPERDDYLASVQMYGSPAYSLDQVRALDEDGRMIADDALQQAYGLQAVKTDDSPPAGADCRARRVEPGAAVSATTKGGSEIWIDAGSGVGASASLARFSTAGASIGPVPAGASEIVLPADAASEPWTLTVTPAGAGRLRICTG